MMIFQVQQKTGLRSADERTRRAKKGDAMSKKIALSIAIFIGLALGISHKAMAADNFYEGKTIRVAVGFSAGGGYDTYTRAVARHMGKHIPGNPEFVVENMTGAGSLVAANYTYNKADRDGTFLGVWNSAYVLYKALGDRAVRLEPEKLGWIGAPVKGSPHCSIMAFTGLDSFEDILKSGKSLKMGATRAGSTYNDLPKILNQTVGTKFDVITGYAGTSKILLGMRSKELEGGCFGWESARVTARPMLEAKGDERLIPVIIHRKWKDPLVKDLPLIPEVIKAKADKDGVAVYKAWGAQYDFQRPWVAPPGVPKDRLEILRKGFAATFKDPEFLAEAEKSKLYLDYVSADEINGLVKDILEITPKAKESLQFLVRKQKET
jgi:tripartite-type tricarboxylate transporter receptor subunit TctC